MVQLTAEMLGDHWRQHHDRLVWQVRYRIVGVHADAEDLVGEAYMRAWRARAQWTPQGRLEDPLSAWIARIITNLIKDRGKRSRRIIASLDVPSSAGETESGPWLIDHAATGALDAAASRIDAAALAPVLLAACRSPDQQEAIGVYMHGRTRAESAAQLGLTPDAFRARVYRGIARMRAAYDELPRDGV
jgi:RNA polymerase sigma factor (sigma-70 family)